MLRRKSKETDQEIRERLLQICDLGVLNLEKHEYDLHPPTMTAQAALHELCRFFLGDNFYIESPVNQEQANLEIVYEIERKYKKKR